MIEGIIQLVLHKGKHQRQVDGEGLTGPKAKETRPNIFRSFYAKGDRRKIWMPKSKMVATCEETVGMIESDDDVMDNVGNNFGLPESSLEDSNSSGDDKDAWSEGEPQSDKDRDSFGGDRRNKATPK